MIVRTRFSCVKPSAGTATTTAAAVAPTTNDDDNDNDDDDERQTTNDDEQQTTNDERRTSNKRSWDPKIFKVLKDEMIPFPLSISYLQSTFIKYPVYLMSITAK